MTNSCKRLMPLDTVPIYIYMLFNPNCYWKKNGNNVFVLKYLVCSLFYRYLNQLFFLHITYPHVRVDMPTIFGSMWAVFKAWLKVSFPWLFVRIPVKFHETTVNKNIYMLICQFIFHSSNHYCVLLQSYIYTWVIPNIFYLHFCRSPPLRWSHPCRGVPPSRSHILGRAPWEPSRLGWFHVFFFYWEYSCNWWVKTYYYQFEWDEHLENKL